MIDRIKSEVARIGYTLVDFRTRHRLDGSVDYVAHGECDGLHATWQGRFNSDDSSNGLFWGHYDMGLEEAREDLQIRARRL